MFDQLDDPKRQALLMMAAGLLSPQDSRMGKGSQFMSALGQGIQGGLLGFNNASREKRRAEGLAQESEIRRMQAEAMKAQQAKQQQIDALGPQFFQQPMTQDDPTSMQFGNTTPGKQDFGGYAQALMGVDPMKGLGLQAQLAQMAAKNIQKVGRDDRLVDITSGAPKTVLDAAPDKPHWVDMGNAVAPFDASGKQVGPAIPKGMAPGESQRLGMDAQRLNLEKGRFGMDAGRYNYEVGNGQGLPQKAVDAIRQDVGKKQAEAQLTAQQELPQAEADAKQTIGLVDKLINHPGFKGSVGLKGPTGMVANVNPQLAAGSDEADWIVLRDQIVGKQFMQAYQTLKGGGQITEVEGKKATDAIARMNTAQSEAAFKEAAGEFRGVIQAGLARAKQKASVGGASGGWSIQRVQ